MNSDRKRGTDAATDQTWPDFRARDRTALQLADYRGTDCNLTRRTLQRSASRLGSDHNLGDGDYHRFALLRCDHRSRIVSRRGREDRVLDGHRWPAVTIVSAVSNPNGCASDERCTGETSSLRGTACGNP